METVEVVIRISAKMYKNMINDVWAGSQLVADAVRNGTVLPKGHGRLFILDEELAKKFFASFSFSCQKWISEVGISNATLKVIEADKGEVKLNMQEPREEFEPSCFDNYCDFDCHNYEIGEGGTPICTYDCERILENEPCHRYKTRGR